MAAVKTAKSLALMTVLVLRTNSFMVSANRRCRQLAAAEARTQSSARYDWVRRRRHLKTIMASWNGICCRIGSQRRVAQYWCYVVKLLDTGHNTCRRILERLKLLQQIVTDPIQQTVAVVKATTDKCIHESSVLAASDISDDRTRQS